MPELTPHIAADVLAACQKGAAEIGEALSRVLDAKVTAAVGEAATFDQGSLPPAWSGPGLVIAMIVGEASAAAILSEADGLLPEWYKNPDPTGESRLMTLAQEFGMLLLPESLMPGDSKAGRVANVAESLARGEPAWPLSCVPLELTAGERRGSLHVAWPIRKTADLFDTSSADAGESEPHDESSFAAACDAADADFHRLPAYARSLLRIDVPVRVALAHKRQRADDIVALGPGQIIQFNKSCDEMLDLLVGRQRVAKGEAVKIGDKFGLRITSIVLPEERFRKVGG
jgi:flagellar motor switch/type III secretory pathway protein FliN